MALTCAADDMKSLRACDAERVVFTAIQNGSAPEVIAWLHTERPDLDNDVQSYLEFLLNRGDET